MFCANCGTKQIEGDKFCPNCGTKFEATSSTNGKEVQPKQEKEVASTESSVNNIDVETKSSAPVKSNKKTKNVEKANEFTGQSSNTQLKREDKYADIWREIEENGDNIPYVVVSFEMAGLITKSFAEEKEIHYDRGDIYKKFDESNGVFEFLSLVNSMHPDMKELCKMINDYNDNADKNGYERIYIDIGDKQSVINAILTKKELGFWETLFSWNPELDFKRIYDMCERIKI